MNVTLKKLAPRSAGLLILLLTLAAALPAAAQSNEDEVERYGDEIDDTPPSPYAAPRSSQVRSNLTRRNSSLFRNSYSYPWKQLYTDQKVFHELQPLPSPFSRQFTGNPSRSTLEPHGNQSYDIVAPPLVLPEYGFSAPYGYEVEPPENGPPRVYVVQSAAEEPAPAAPQSAARTPSAARPPAASSPARAVPSQPGRLTFRVRLAGTRILVNDRLLGTGESLGEAVEMKPGVYALEAEHDSYPTQRLMFTVRSQENVGIVIDLTAEVAYLEKEDSFSP